MKKLNIILQVMLFAISSASLADVSQAVKFDLQGYTLAESVLTTPSEDLDLSPLEEHFSGSIASGEAEYLEQANLVAFFNERVNQNYQRRILGLQIEIREELLISEDMFMCVDNNLSGFPTEPGLEDEKVVLEKTPFALEIIDSVGIVTERERGNGSKVEDHYVRIRYVDGEAYWVKKAIKNLNSGLTTAYITRFSDCTKIQSEIEDHRYALAVEDIRSSIPMRSSRLRYVCTQNDPLTASETTNLGREHRLAKGSEVAVLQGSSSAAFVGEDGHTYIRVQHERERYWVAERYIKIYDDCPSVHTEAVEVCVESGLNYYKTSEQLSSREPEGEFGAFQSVYRDYGHIYSKKIRLQGDGSEVTFVPVKTRQDSSEVLWVAEEYVPETCGLDNDAEVTFRGRQNSCTVRRNDNFPLAHKAKFDYYASPARFGNSRPSGRTHGAVDLYSFSRGSGDAANIWGTRFYAIDDGRVTSINDYGRETKRITIQSDYGYTWNYAEVGRLQFATGDRVSRGDHIGTTRKYVLNDPDRLYPPMLHTEKFNARITSPKSVPQNNTYGRHVSIVNPSCHVEYMEQYKTF